MLNVITKMIFERCLILSKTIIAECNRGLLLATGPLQFKKTITIVNRRQLRKAAYQPQTVNQELQDAPAYSSPRIIPRTRDEFETVRGNPLKSPPNSRVLTVSIIGAPNAGKSTLANTLMGWRVCPVSNKVHTTRENTKAIILEGDIQIVLSDTPGIVSVQEKRKHHLDSKMANDPKASIQKADLVVVIVDASNRWTRYKLHDKIIQLLELHNDKTSVLVLNKVDILKSKPILLDITNSLTNGVVDGQPISDRKKLPPPTKTLKQLFEKTETLLETRNERRQEPDDTTGSSSECPSNSFGWPNFKKVFMVSSLDGDGVNDLRDYLLSQSKRGLWLHKPSMVTDQKPEDIAINAVRAKLLDHLPQEIPYNLDLAIEMWDIDTYGFLRISMLIQCPLKHQVKLVIGESGKRIRTISEEARQELMNTFHCELSLKLVVQYCKKEKQKF